MHNDIFMKKHPLHITIFLLLFFISNSYAQKIDLMLLPTEKRDSILVEIAKKTVLKHGPDYYRADREVKIDGSGESWTGSKGKFRFFSVSFASKPREEDLWCDYAAEVYINIDTRKPFFIAFGNGYRAYNEPGHFQDTIIPYQQRHEVPLPPLRPIRNSLNLDDPFYSDDSRDSTLSSWCRIFMEKFAPEYYREDYKPEITKGISLDDGGRSITISAAYIPRDPREGPTDKEEREFGRYKYYIVSYLYDGREEYFSRNYSAQIEIWAKTSELRQVKFGNGIEIKLSGALMEEISDTRGRNKFLLPLMQSGLELDPQRKKVRLDSLVANTRDSLLLQLSKEAVLTIGPGYYREYQRPLTDSTTMVNVGQGEMKHYYQKYLPPKICSKTWKEHDKNKNRMYYEVNLYRNPLEDNLYNKEAAKVKVWADTGDVFSIHFGNNVLVNFDGLDYRKMKEIVPYQDRKLK